MFLEVKRICKFYETNCDDFVKKSFHAVGESLNVHVSVWKYNVFLLLLSNF